MGGAQVGRLLMLVGGVLLVLGLFLTFFGKIPVLGRLPGDFVYRKDDFTLYVPLGSSLMLSVVLTLLLAVLRRD